MVGALVFTMPSFANKTQISLICMICLLYVASGWILRLRCKTEGSFDIQLPNVAMISNVIERASTTLHGCMEACLFTRGCKSFNYKENAVDNCELNNETKLTAKREAMVVRGNWSYFATDQTTLLIGSNCRRQNPCGTKYCVDRCDCPGYRCVECGDAYEKSYGWYCLNGETEPTWSSKLAVTSSLSQLVDDITVPSPENCLQLHGNVKNFVEIKFTNGNALVYAVVIQGYVNMINTHLQITLSKKMVGNSYHNRACIKGEFLTTMNESKRFICRENVEGDKLWIEVLPSTKMLEICEVMVYGKTLYQMLT